MNSTSGAPRLVWKEIKELEENGVLVVVSASDGTRPRYNVRVGRRGERGVIPFLPLFVKGQGKVHVTPIADTISRLVCEAEKFVEGLAQDDEDKFIEARMARESKQVEREGKKRRTAYKQQR